ncbi:MAG: endonuclease domain-containing protein [Pirellula sp.]|nr:endonuclease domain-containing protein [Pirellula sp.]
MKWLEPQDFSEHLRKAMTPAEHLLWQLIRNRQRCNGKFRQQYVEGAYLLDFYCPEAKLCVECDGLPHFTPEGIRKIVSEPNGSLNKGSKSFGSPAKKSRTIHNTYFKRSIKL